MEKIDPQLQSRVWQRVRGEEPKQNLPDTLKALAAAKWQQAAAYLMLSRQLQGREKALVRRMFEEEQAQAACLKGAYTMLTGEPLTARTPPPVPEAPEITLRKCCGRELRALAQYESAAEHGEYGPVLARLAQQEREHCRMILEVLGLLRR